MSTHSDDRDVFHDAPTHQTPGDSQVRPPADNSPSATPGGQSEAGYSGEIEAPTTAPDAPRCPPAELFQDTDDLGGDNGSFVSPPGSAHSNYSGDTLSGRPQQLGRGQHWIQYSQSTHPLLLALQLMTLGDGDGYVIRNPPPTASVSGGGAPYGWGDRTGGMESSFQDNSANRQPRRAHRDRSARNAGLSLEPETHIAFATSLYGDPPVGHYESASDTGRDDPSRGRRISARFRRGLSRFTAPFRSGDDRTRDARRGV
ncbi:uncharacterized protein L203_104977 [Cryptococcus depauperatus CBS 7841]|uniref:Uncharacterized protein n=1 Tax=Cryptococcus depauperatus CBS 7841 TaxID=1295531 RepID=A0A1E3IQA9_9TREE|nr:hypothetical protein L203_01808 [Cryptococcus depauperatus CBS 7841]